VLQVNQTIHYFISQTIHQAINQVSGQSSSQIKQYPIIILRKFAGSRAKVTKQSKQRSSKTRGNRGVK
jgi:hypothetical protein